MDVIKITSLRRERVREGADSVIAMQRKGAKMSGRMGVFKKVV